MRKVAGDLWVGELFKYEQEIYLPISSCGGEVFAIKLENLLHIPSNMVIDSVDSRIFEKEEIDNAEI